MSKRLRQFSGLTPTYKKVDESESDKETPEDTSDEKKEDEEYASFLEKIIATYLAPETLTQEGRLTILTIWALLATCSILGASNIQSNFSIEFFIEPGSTLDGFIQLDIRNFQTGYGSDIYSYTVNTDLTSEESQYKIIDFYEKLSKCYMCDEQWFRNPFLWNIWYWKFN